MDDIQRLKMTFLDRRCMRTDEIAPLGTLTDPFSGVCHYML